MSSPLRTGKHTTFGRVDPMPSFGDAMRASFDIAAEDTPTENLKSIIELRDKKQGLKVSMDRLNEKYDLDLREDTTEEYAQAVYETRQRTAKLNRIVEDGTRNSPTLGMVGSFGVGMLPEVVDPINIGASLLMGPAASKIFGAALKARNASKVARYIAKRGAFLRSTPMAANVAEGIAGNLAADIFVVYGNELKRSDATMSNILGMSIATGAAFPVIGGLFKKFAKKISRRSGPSDTAEINHKEVLTEYRQDVAELSDDIVQEFDSGATIEKFNLNLEELDEQILALEKTNPLTKTGIKNKNIDLQSLKEVRNIILKTREEILKSNKSKVSKGPSLESQFKKIERRDLVEAKVKERIKVLDHTATNIKKRMDKLEDLINVPIKANGIEGLKEFKINNHQRNQWINEYRSLEQQLDFVDRANNILDTSLSAKNRQNELDEIDSLLFGNGEFDYISLSSDNIAKLHEYHKSSLDNGVKPDMDAAITSIQRKSVLPQIEKEMKILMAKTDRGLALNAREKARLDYLAKKSDEINSLPVNKKDGVKTVEKLWTKYDPDESVKGQDVKEMEAQVFNERVTDPEVKKRITDFGKVAELAANCRIEETRGE